MGQGLAQMAFLLLVSENVSSLFTYHPPNMVCWWVLIHFGPVIWPYITLWQLQTQESQDTYRFNSSCRRSQMMTQMSIEFHNEWLLGSCCPMKLKSQKCPPLKLLQWPDMYTGSLLLWRTSSFCSKKVSEIFGSSSSSSSTHKWNLESGLGLALQKEVWFLFWFQFWKIRASSSLIPQNPNWN